MNSSVNSTSFLNATISDDNSVLGVSYLIVSVLIMLTNGVVVFVIVKTRELHLPTLWVIAHMAVWDFLQGLHFMVFSVPSALYNKFAFPQAVIGWSACINTLITGQSVFNTSMTVADRFIAVKFPLDYTRIATKRNYGIATAATTLMSVCRLLLIVLPDKDFYFNPVIAVCLSDFDTVHGTFASTVIILASFIMIVVGSCILSAEILRRRRQILPEGTMRGAPKKLAKFPLMILLCAGIFCLSYFPIFVSVIWNFTAGKENIPRGFFKFVSVSYLSNSIWNVFIYTATYKPFRESLTFLFCKLYYRRKRWENMQSTLGN